MDRIFNRVPNFDQRSRQFPITQMVNASDAAPRSYSWRSRKVLDQGMSGHCVGFAWAGELIARPSEVEVDEGFARKLYFNAQRLDEWEGGEYPGASVEYEGSSILGGAKATTLSGYISGYRWGFGLWDLLIGVSYHGPAVLGINWYESMMVPDGKAHISPGGDWLGGHAILCRGIDVGHERLLLRNSWGTGWGAKGDCWISFRDMDRLLEEDGEVCFAVGRTSSTLVPE